ncbi:MAG: hypothetical protein ACRD47_12920, partial [Nitrososphaeraceae archaeon]
KSVKGFIEVAKKKQENKQLVIKTVAENKDIKEIETQVTELCESCGIEITEDDKQEGKGDTNNANSRPRTKSRWK